jgi:hypothetical protein
MAILLSDPVTVSLYCDHKRHISVPQIIVWHQQTYTVDQVGLHHTLYQGTDLHHIFSVTAGSTYMRLRFKSSDLSWTLEDISDGSSD